ncbi:MAG TPA: YCF48-related protein, partial [bacterium]
MKKYFFGLILLFPLIQMACTGSGAVNPLSPNKASQLDSASSTDSDVIYWTSYPVTFTMTDALNGVYLVSKKFGWACGNNGLLLKWDGDTWTKVETGLARNENLLAVAFADENNGWIVGSHGTILSYKTGAWSLDDSQTQETLYGLAVTRSRTVWVTGSNGTLLTYNGVSWGKIVVTDFAGVAVKGDLYSVALSDQNNGWAVGNLGLILHYDGQKWQPYQGSASSTEKLNSVSVVSDVQAWIVGAFGTILRYNGTTWSKMLTVFSGFDLYNVFMKNDSDGWATGQDGTLIYYDGSRWISHEKPKDKPSLNAVSFCKDLGFVVGQNGTILKYEPNGEPAKFSFLFKGEVAKKPTKANPYWTVNYTIMNQSPKPVPSVVYELPIPKGFEPYQKKDVSPTPMDTVSVVLNTPTPTPTAQATPAKGTPTLTSSGAARSTSSVMGSWKVKDGNLDWEVGSVSSSEIKTVTVLLQEKNGEKKEYPVLLKAVLKSMD